VSEFYTPLRSLHVEGSGGIVSKVEVDGKPVYNVTKLVIDASKEYVEATVTFLPGDVVFTGEQATLVCGDCGAGLRLVEKDDLALSALSGPPVNIPVFDRPRGGKR
jgi:hypothetical protein